MSAESASAILKNQVDLLDFVDWSGVECLNQSTSHSLANALKQGYREDEGLNLESDADEQLLIYLPFTQVIKLHSIFIKGTEDEGPKTVKLFTNREHMGFSNVNDFPPSDTAELSPDNLKIFATLIFRCDMLLLLCPLGLELLLTRSISLWKALKYCIGTALLCIGLTVLVDTIMWRKLLWPEFEVLWFNSVLNRSSEWGTHPIHWYFTSALPRSLLAAYPLFLLGVLLDRRIVFYILPVFSFVLLYSKLPHKELRFIISTVPMFNLSAAIAASRIYNNRKKSFWKLLHIVFLGLLMISLGCTIITFMASYENYPSGFALKDLHKMGGLTNNTNERWVHIDPFSAMNGISRFCEYDFPWRYSKEEGIAIEEFIMRNFTYLLNEHSNIRGFECLFAISGFSKVQLQTGFLPISLVKEPKVFILGNIRNKDVMNRSWPGCS